MFYALPAETVLEARARTRRDTFILFTLLVVLYVFFADLLAATTVFFLGFLDPSPGRGWGGILLYVSLGAALLAILHFFTVRAQSLDGMLSKVRARPADEKDRYHLQFIHLVEEAGAATGLRAIRPVVIADPGCNAFSLQDGAGRSAIGATEGLLARLNRAELSAVVAHEAAHLLHGDSRLVSTACFLFSVFGRIHSALGATLQAGAYASSGRRSSSRGGGGAALILALWLVSGLGYLVTRLVSMAVSREREYLADADGVSICKDPFAMAESLDKISRRYRGGLPDTYAALFILNPSDSQMDEKEGFFPDLFSNHPPVSRRLSKLLDWAKSDLIALREAEEGEEKNARDSAAPASPDPGAQDSFRAFQDNQWIGPYSATQWLALGLLTPATWICPSGSREVCRASDRPELLPLFQRQVQGSVTRQSCPRCKVPLVEVRYEGTEAGQCAFCRGYLLRAGVLERLIVREDVAFSPEDVKKARNWRDAQKGPLKGRDGFPEIRCPYCGGPMGKGVHSMLTQVVLDRCSDENCGALWLDGGELETIQMLIEDAHAAPSV